MRRFSHEYGHRFCNQPTNSSITSAQFHNRPPSAGPIGRDSKPQFKTSHVKLSVGFIPIVRYSSTSYTGQRLHGFRALGGAVAIP